MSNVIDFAEYKESKKFSSFDTDIPCGCGGVMWQATHYQTDDVGNDIARAEKVLVCHDCGALVALGLET